MSQRSTFVALIFLTLAVVPAIAQGTGELQIVAISGDNQMTEPSQQSAPLVVQVQDLEGQPVAGASVSWNGSPSALNGSPVTFFANGETTVTDANGMTQNAVTMILPVTHSIRAFPPDSNTPVVFTLVNRLANNGLLSANERQVAAAVDQACPALVGISLETGNLTAEQGDLLDRCSAMVASPSSASLRNAYDQVAREEVAAVLRNSTETASGQRDNIETRMSALRGGSVQRIASLEGLTVALNGTAVPLAMAYQGDSGKDIDAPRGGFYINGNISFGDREARDGDFEKGFDFDSQSVTAGFDRAVGQKTFLGAALGYSTSESDFFNDGGGLEVEGYSLSGYVSHNVTDQFFVDGVVTFGQNDYDSSTPINYSLPNGSGGVDIVDQVATGETSGDFFSVSLSAGYDVSREALTWQTYGQATYTDLTVDAYDEQLIAGLPGFGLGLHVGQQDIESMALVFGQSLTYAVSTSWGVLLPHLRVEWEHELEDEARTVSTFLLHDPNRQTIQMTTDPLDADQLNVGVGISAVFKGGNQFFLYYEKAFELERVDYNSIDFGFRFEF